MLKSEYQIWLDEVILIIAWASDDSDEDADIIVSYYPHHLGVSFSKWMTDICLGASYIWAED